MEQKHQYHEQLDLLWLLSLICVTLKTHFTVEINDLTNHQQLTYLSFMLRIKNNKNVAKHLFPYKIIYRAMQTAPPCAALL